MSIRGDDRHIGGHLSAWTTKPQRGSVGKLLHARPLVETHTCLEHRAPQREHVFAGTEHSPAPFEDPTTKRRGKLTISHPTPVQKLDVAP